METSPLSVRDYKLQTYSWRLWSLGMEGSLSCCAFCNSGPRFLWFHPEDRPILSPCMRRRYCGIFLRSALISVYVMGEGGRSRPPSPKGLHTYFVYQYLRRWCSGPKRSPRKRKVGCSNPSRDRPKSSTAKRSAIDVSVTGHPR